MKNNNPLIPSENKFDFSSINKNLELPKDPTIDELIDDDYQTMLNKHADMINKFAPQASSNSLLPANATDMFNPYEQNTGGTQKFIALGVIRQLKILLPSLPEQTRIANFLTSLDDKINNCELLIDNCELYKKGLLQQMFV